MNKSIEQFYLNDTAASFENYRKLAEKAIDQVSETEFFHRLDEESNSIATIAKHIAGNLRSRWTDFLTSDGEKPDRERDLEFVRLGTENKAVILGFWNEGWNALFDSINSLAPADLQKTVQIRGENYLVLRAINRSLAHTAYHVGQIAFLAKHLRGAQWETLSIPKNKSDEFNQYLQNRGRAENSQTLIETHEEFASRLKDDDSEPNN